jgi:AbrB family looped-hinge helix DNA binding protein
MIAFSPGHAIIPEIPNFWNSGELMTTLQIRGKGTITLPASLRKKYKLEEGEVLTVIDLGEGSILLKPMVSEVNKLSRQMAKRLKEENVTLDDLLQQLDKERKNYYQEHYAKK